MAINSDEILSSPDCKKRIKKFKRKKIKMFGDGLDKCSTSSAASKQSIIKLNSRDQSPYLCQDAVNKLNFRQLQRKQVSNSKAITAVHKANSDEIAIIQDNEWKKAKKSVLTLPNHGKLTEMAQFTVSDMNESEYDNNQNMNHTRKYKKRLRFSRKRKQRVDNDNYKYYDRDEVYCTQLDIDMNESSTDLLNDINFNKMITKNTTHKNKQPEKDLFAGNDISFNKRTTKNTTHKNKQPEKDLFAGNIWAILKNINPFQFRPTPKISEDSLVGTKNKKITRRNKKCMESRILKTRNTESFAYISSVEMNSQISPSLSKSSSFDRVTVIDKRNDAADSQASLEDMSVIDLNIPKVQEFIKNRNSNAKEIYRKSWNRMDNNNILTLSGSTKENEKSVKKGMLVFDNSYINNLKGNIASVENVTYKTSPINYVRPSNKIVTTKESKVKSPVNTSIRRAPNVTTTEIKYEKDNEMNVSQKERKLRLVTIMPSTTMKMTQAEIKRQREKDQLSSTVRVEEFPIKIPKVQDLCCIKNKNSNAKEIYRQSWNRMHNNNILTLPENTQKRENSIKKDKLVFDNSYIKNSKGNIPTVENVIYKTSPINYVSPPKKIVSTKESKIKSPVNTPIRHTPNVTATEIEYEKDNEVNVSQKERKFRRVTTMPSSTMKITQAEIKRRIAAIKFPIVVLGKDQLSSTVRNQSHNSAIKIKSNNVQIETNALRDNKQVKTNTKSKMASDVAKETLDTRSYNRPLCRHPDDQMLQNKMSISKGTTQQTTRLDITDKMVKLLYKKSSSNIHNSKKMSCKKSCNDNNNDINNSFITEYINDETYAESPKNLLIKKPTLHNTKQIADFKNVWSKSKYSNDLIDNVITKIKQGIYSNHIPVQKHYVSHTSSIADKCMETPILNVIPNKDVIVQTHKTSQTNSIRRIERSIKDKDFIEYFAPQNQFNNILKTIPGFNHTLPKLTIEELKQDQVVVKHCVKNVFIQFDISEVGKVDSRITNTLQTTYCVPLTATANNIYKCKNVIINATLPEQLCTILPNIIRYTLQDKTINHHTNILNNSCGLFPISEVCTNESIYSVPSHPATAPCAAILPSELSMEISMKNNNMANVNTIGSFNRTKERLKKKLKLKSISSMKLDECKKMLTKLINVDRICSIECITSNIFFQRAEVNAPISSCTAIVPYTGGNTTYRSSTIKNTHESSWTLFPNTSNIINIKCDLSNILNIVQCNNTYCLNLELSNYDFIEKIKNSLCGNIMFEKMAQRKILPYIQFYNNAITRSNVDNGKLEVVKEIAAAISIIKCKTKNGKRSKIRRIKKFPSTTTISTKNKNLIPLNTICSIEDFFQVLCLEKKVTKVLNGQYSENILSSLAEMKKWVDDITPNQAFIILLLINKSQSDNVKRCRSLILQGIAMNRITLASELDMEIEVIEKENLNISTQHEDNSHLPASVESYDNLLEEMYWIAKTTASDHQRPFNENTKKLIKSFLSKRKTQNPSYLRVMARYIGLGLLNTQGKYTTKQFK